MSFCCVLQGLPKLRALSIPFVCTEAASSTAVTAIITAINTARLPSLDSLDLAYRDVGGDTFLALLSALSHHCWGKMASADLKMCLAIPHRCCGCLRPQISQPTSQPH